jgi:two-component system, OmpR family, phosphate regulon response regulator PhoB
MNILMNNINPSILFISETESILANLSYNLKKYGYIVYNASDFDEALYIATTNHINMVITNDTKNSNLFCKNLIDNNFSKGLSILMLTASNDNHTNEKYTYLPTDLPTSEVISEIRNILDNSKSITKETSDILKYADIELHLASYKVYRDDKVIKLGPTEFKLLRYFMENAEKTLSRKMLMKKIWPNTIIEDRTIDVHINRLRKSLAKENDKSYLIETIRSAGYCLRMDVE